jgi:Uma2 family endonuclease
MSTVPRSRLSPEMKGHRFTLEEFTHADWKEGYRYELIDGRLSVSPMPNPPGGILEDWLLFKLKLYSRSNPEITNFVYNKSRVFVPGRKGVTNPEPDIAAFRDFPLDEDYREVRWQETTPILVVEVLHSDDAEKDTVRNIELYHQVPSIKEYWILDGRENPNEPAMLVHIRHGKGWRVKTVRHGDTYTTRLLPGFELLIDPRR